MAIYRGDTKVSGVGKGFRPENPGTEGQVLTKTSTGYAYQDVEALPDGGEVGNKLAKTATGSERVDGELVEIKADDYSAMRGPCDEGFHIASLTEWQGLKSIMDSLSLTTGDAWRINLHMPLSGRRDYYSSPGLQGNDGYYWSSTPRNRSARAIEVSSARIDEYYYSRAEAYSIRGFKDSYLAPTSSWTVVQGTLGSAGIFWNQSDGLISITDGATGYTIQDKNLGATTVYNDGDTLSETNCGKYYAWGNNYGFAWTGSITTSNTQVDASSYGPGNYYSSSTFIIRRSDPFDWSSVQNDDLRGGVTGVIPGGKFIGDSKINEVPTEGTVGQVLTKTDDGYGFQNVVNSINGKTGNVKNAILNIPYENYSKVYDNIATLGNTTSEHSIGSTQVIASPSGTKIILYIIMINNIVLYKRLFSGYSSANDSFDILSINTSSNAIEAYMRVGIHYYGSGNITKEAVVIKHPSSRSSVTIKETIYCFTQ